MKVIRPMVPIIQNHGRNVNSHVRFYLDPTDCVYSAKGLIMLKDRSCCDEKILDPYKGVQFNFSLKTLLFEHLPRPSFDRGALVT